MVYRRSNKAAATTPSFWERQFPSPGPMGVKKRGHPHINRDDGKQFKKCYFMPWIWERWREGGDMERLVRVFDGSSFWKQLQGNNNRTFSHWRDPSPNSLTWGFNLHGKQTLILNCAHNYFVLNIRPFILTFRFCRYGPLKLHLHLTSDLTSTYFRVDMNSLNMHPDKTAEKWQLPYQVWTRDGQYFLLT